MQKLSTVLRQHAFHLLLLLAALAFFCKPMLLATESESPAEVMLSLFVPWGLVVLVLFLIARASDRGPDPEDVAEELEHD